MNEPILAQTPSTTELPAPSSATKNILRYVFRRTAVLIVTVVVAVYITIIIANLGGFVDDIVRAEIGLALMGRARAGWLSDVTDTDEKAAIIAETQLAMEESAGLHDPFLLRTLRWLKDGITLNWGESTRPRAYAGGTYATDVRTIILDHIARSLVVFGFAYLLLFFVSVFVGLLLLRRYGGWLDKIFVMLSPLSSAPAWVYGILLSFIFLHLFTFSTGGTFDTWPQDFQFAYIPILLKHLMLPFLAIFISGLFLSVNTWRSFFMLYANEDYVEMAKARGLSPQQIERGYILRPALPGLITSFALMTIVLWQEIIAIEYFFNVAGIGRLFIAALRSFDTPMIVGLTVTFAYILALTVFLLEIVYALVDPRVRVGGDNLKRGSSGKTQSRWLFWKKQRPKPAHVSSIPEVEVHKQHTRGFRVANLGNFLKQQLVGAGRIMRQLFEYPSAVVGLLIIIGFLLVSVYTVFAIPYQEAIVLWRSDNDAWARNPRDAQPTWVNWFRVNDLPPTMVMTAEDTAVTREVTQSSENITKIEMTFPIAYPYGDFPQDIALYITAEYDEKLPNITLTWVPPEGEEVRITSFTMNGNRETYYFSQDNRLKRRLDSELPQQVIFTQPDAAGETAVPVKGDYKLVMTALVFEENADVDAEFVLYGQVHGLAGTDAKRRDLMVALLWGTPVALAFGLVAAITVSLSGMLLAAISTWFGGWVDGLIQFLTEVNLILPFFAVSLMIFTLYSRSLWVVLGVTILLSIFGHSVKTYRATFLQIKTSPYIEAAQAYGAKDRRIVVRYLIPRIMPILVPKLIVLVPTFVFLEATLAFLGVSDPALPTWGKLIVDALSSEIHRGAYHTALEPLGLLLLVGFAFAMVGLALEKIFEPRLRDH